MKWKPIETAPKDGTLFFATGLNQNETNEHRHYCVCFFSEFRGKFTGPDWPIIYDKLTHWMPFQPPEDQQQFSSETQHPPV